MGDDWRDNSVQLCSTFAAFGIAYVLSVPIIGLLPAKVMCPDNRGHEIGIYQLWYFIGSAYFAIAGGYLKDWTGNTRKGYCRMLLVYLFLPFARGRGGLSIQA